MTLSSDRLIVLSLGPRSRVLSLATDGTDERVLVDDLVSKPDGVTIDPARKHIYYTFMGATRTGEGDFWENEGEIERCNYDGSDRKTILPAGSFVTGKQCIFDAATQRLYWCDREGMRVMSCKPDGSDLHTHVQTGAGEDKHDAGRHCVGVAVDAAGGWLYWTQKGAPKGGEGRISRVPLAPLAAGADPAQRGDIEVILSGLPEPIDLEWDEGNQTMYWTDRGQPPKGNTLNRAKIVDGKAVDHEILLSDLHEAIGLALDLPGRRAFVSELAGRIYKVDLDKPGKGEIIYHGRGRLVGMALQRGEYSFELPQNIETRPIVILGAGTLGRRIAMMMATRGAEVRLYDPNAEVREEGVAYAREQLPAVLEKIPDGKPGTIVGFDDMAAALKGAWHVVEAVPEKLELKKSIFKQIDELSDPDAILASNSSSYPTSAFRDSVKNPARLLNMHYLMPPRATPVELMSCGYTAPAVIDLIAKLLPSYGLTPYIVEAESMGFIYNRIWAAIKREALCVVAAGVAKPEVIDAIFRQAMGTRVGPCAAMDNVGLDVVLSIEEHYAHEIPGLPEAPRTLLKQMLAEGRLGVKSGHGFYDYSAKK
ncbi:MAG: 3-hydroxyacyl-CoA dehydrogenase NAD-binding domain-containing protein [Acidovorax sp.]